MGSGCLQRTQSTRPVSAQTFTHDPQGIGARGTSQHPPPHRVPMWLHYRPPPRLYDLCPTTGTPPLAYPRSGGHSPSCSGVCEPYMGVREPEPYMGVWAPYMGVRP